MSNVVRARVRAVMALGLVMALASACGSSTTATPTAGSSVPAAGDAASAAKDRPVLGPADSTATPSTGGRAVFALEAEPDGLDPSRSSFDASGHMMASAVFDPLATLDANGKAIPYLASAIDPSEDSKVWTITLRPDVRFHDGSPLDSAALKTNFDYWTQSFITAPSLVSVDHVDVVDPLTVKVTMKQPWTSFPYTLTTQTGYVAAPAFLQNPDASVTSVEAIGTGPFKFTEYIKGKSFTVDRNPDYWQKGLPYLSQIQFRFMPDALSRLSDLNDGTVDLLHAYQPIVVTKAREEAAAGRLKAVENGGGEEDVIGINTAKEPFDDVTARRALAYATDAEKWREIAETNAKHDVHGPFAPGQLGFSTDDGYPAFDLAKATQLASEYQAKHGKPIEAEVLTTPNVDDQAQMQLLVDQWAKAGIKVTIKSSELSGLIAQVVLGTYQLAGWRNFGSIDPDGDYLWWHSNAIQPSPKISTNVARFSDSEIDKALDDARGTSDPAKRAADYELVTRRLNDGVPYVWLGRPTWVIAASPRVQGISGAANGSGATLGAKTWLAKLWIAS